MSKRSRRGRPADSDGSMSERPTRTITDTSTSTSLSSASTGHRGPGSSCTRTDSRARSSRERSASTRGSCRRSSICTPNFYITLGGTAFRGNDTMGSELAARGWTFGNRLSVYDEVIASVPDTTRPIGSEIDHRIGDSERLRLQLPERAMIQFARVDNRSQLLFRNPPDVPWRTHFNVISGDVGASSPTTLAGEWAYGTTTVGFPGGTFDL